MKHRRSSTQLLDKAIRGFIFFKTAEGLQDRSIDSYQRILDQCLDYWRPVDISSLTSQDISAYLSWLRTDFVPCHITGITQESWQKIDTLPLVDFAIYVQLF